MIKSYYVQVVRKDNRYGNVEKFAIKREGSFVSCKSCYLNASNILDSLAVNDDINWVKIGAVLLYDYAAERSRVVKVKELVHTSEFYTYIVTISCEE